MPLLFRHVLVAVEEIFLSTNLCKVFSARVTVDVVLKDLPALQEDFEPHFDMANAVRTENRGYLDRTYKTARTRPLFDFTLRTTAVLLFF